MRKKITKKISQNKYNKNKYNKNKYNKNKIRSYIYIALTGLLSFTGFTAYTGNLRPILKEISYIAADFIASPPVMQGDLKRIADGDTLTIKGADAQDIKVRLYGIDAPELSQNFGEQSRNELAKIIQNKHINLEIIDIDKYGRTVAVVYVDDINVNEYMLENGYAWYYENYCKKRFCSKWHQLELTARNNRTGLWQSKKPIEPWVYRQNKNGGG